MTKVIKRDGNIVDFDTNKITCAIKKAFKACNKRPLNSSISQVIDNVSKFIIKNKKKSIDVEKIQDLVEEGLMKVNPTVAKTYILYREQRNKERYVRSAICKTLGEISSAGTNDTNMQNANISGKSPQGMMANIASESTKEYALNCLISPIYAKMHRQGDIHIHDLDYYITKAINCCQYNLDELFKKGFHNKNGSIRPPQSIQSYASLAAIVFQSAQNECFGGQAIPAFDFFMAPGVLKSFRKYLLDAIVMYKQFNNTVLSNADTFKDRIRDLVPSIELTDMDKIDIASDFNITLEELDKCIGIAMEYLKRSTYQSMESFIHNLNHMMSRGGNQVVFSSINYGTDTSPEGRLVMKMLLKATKAGLGKEEVPIFPIQILKVKDGVNYSEEDFKLAQKDLKKALAGKVKFKTPNFDIFLQACEVTSHSLFPNFIFEDMVLNKDPSWNKNDPERWKHEVATMGCRTRVYENLHGDKTSVSRGNLSFTSMNLPRMAIQISKKYKNKKDKLDYFKSLVRERAFLIANQLKERMDWQKTAYASQFPFLMSNGIWKDGDSLKPNDKVEDVLNKGTLAIGFVGLAEALYVLFGKTHDEDKSVWKYAYDVVKSIQDVAVECKKKYNLNYAAFATPAESLCARFLKLDRKEFGVIKGVTDRDYYTNSFHVPVYHKISMVDKIKCEAPFHEITPGGHISYVELDGDASKNVSAILKIVKVMHDSGIGYGSINHQRDHCNDCGYNGIIYSKCPICKSENISRLRRITGYLTGSLESWNSGKKAEEKDRTKHI